MHVPTPAGSSPQQLTLMSPTVAVTVAQSETRGLSL